MLVGSSADVRSMAGVSAPLGFFDPIGVTNNMSVGRVNFLRQVEVKHGRVAMLASVGFLTAEQWHPLFGGHVDGLSLTAFQETADLLDAASGMYTPLKAFWPTIVLFIAIPEVFSVFSYESPATEFWSMRDVDRAAGDLDFDPLGLRPDRFIPDGDKTILSGAASMKTMQTRELNHGRLAMIGISCMVAQELITSEKLF